MKVSVVIPCHNEELYLGGALESVLGQSHRPLEVIVVDDGSTDRSREIAAEFGEAIHLLEGQQRGAAAARNRGAGVVGGDAILFLDADDLLGPRAIEGMVSGLREGLPSVALGPWYRLVHRDDEWITAPATCPPRVLGHDHLQAWLSGWYHPPCSVLWSREAYERAGEWDEELTVNDDGDLVMRALALDVAFVETRAGASYYRLGRASDVTLSGKARTEKGLRSRLRVLWKLVSLLEQRRRLHLYRRELGLAFEDVARDCGRHEDLEEEAREAARRFAGPGWMRGLRRWKSRQLRRVGRWLEQSGETGEEMGLPEGDLSADHRDDPAESREPGAS